MIFRIILIFFAQAILALPAAYTQTSSATESSDQQINDFSLAGYGEKGKKAWDLAGKSADIFTEVIKLNDVIGNMYGQDEDIKLTADKGDFNKTDGRMHLEKNVVITTSKGAKLLTDSLDWDRKQQLVTTPDMVNIHRDNMVINAIGAKGNPDLKKVALEKDIKLDINPAKQDDSQFLDLKEKITITCDGPLEIDYDKNVAVFNNNVKVDRSDSQIYSDKMDVYFTASNKTGSSSEGTKDAKEASVGLAGNKIDKIIARGNVKVVRGENISYSEEAVYSSLDKKIILKGKPRLIIYSAKDFGDASLGN